MDNALPSKIPSSFVPVNDIRQQKSVTSIHSLPPELLLSIFTSVMGTWGDYNILVPRDLKAYYAALRTLRLVACGWSSAIDNSPRFWIYMDPFAPDATWRMALERSQDMLLDVDCMSTRRHEQQRLPQSFLHQIPSFSQRVHTLKIKEMNLEELVNTGFRISGLASLFVRHNTHPGRQQASWTTKLASWAPNLLKVSLMDCSFDWPDPGWTNLESLGIVVNDPRRSFNLAKVLEILSASPLLKHLKLGGLQSICVPTGPQLSMAHLPKLETLEVSFKSTPAAFQLLDSIVASPTAGLRLNISKENLSTPQLRALGRFTARLDLTGARITVGDDSVDVGPLWIRIFKTNKDPLLDELRAFLEGIGKSRLKDIETLHLQAGHFAVYSMVQEFCPTVRSLGLGIINSRFLSFLSSGCSDSHRVWLFPYASSGRGSAHCRESITETFRMLKARADAYDEGEIVEKIRRLELYLAGSIRTGEADRDALIAEAQGWKNEMRNLDPDV
ncbi:hypothetical protein FRB90_007052, partial [Tulasnella sp. 427]